MMKVLQAFAASLLFLLILFVVYALHINFFNVDVVLYSALMDVLLAASIAATLLAALKVFGRLNAFEKVELGVIWLLAGFAVAISVPTIVDRSLSLYMLEKIEQRGGGIQQARFEEVFTKEFAHEHRLVDARLTEQLTSGTVTIEHGCVKLTERGVHIADASRYFRTHFLPRHRLLMGKYSDVLTDPFRDSPKSFDYGCQ